MADEVARTAIVFDASGAKRGADEFAAAGEKVIATNTKVEQSVTRTGKAAKDAAAVQAAAAAAGGDAIATATNRIVVSADRQAAMLDRYAKQLDPMAAAVARYQHQVANLNDVVQQQGPHAARASELLVVAQQKLVTAQQAVGKATSDTSRTLDAHAKSSNAASFAMRDLGIQSIDVFSQMSSGAPIMTTLIQQGSQVAQVMAASGVGFRALATNVGSVFASIARWVAANPLTVGLGLITAALGGIAIAAEAASRRFIDLSQQLRVVTSDYTALATTIDRASKTAGATTTLSTAQARTVQQAIVSQAAFAPRDEASLVRLTKLTADIARTFREDLATAATRVATALQAPAKAAQDLADKQFPGMTQALARHVDMLVKQGKVAEAQAIVLDVYTKSLGEASEAGTPVTRLLNDMAKGWDVLTTALGDFTNKAVGWIEELRKRGHGLKDFPVPPMTPTVTGQELIDSQVTALRQAFPSLFTAGGTVLTDQTPGVPAASIGHGVMQVVPRTAEGRGLPAGFIDANAGQNIIAGLGLLNDLFKQYGGDMRAITKAYGGFSDANVAGLDKRMAKQSAANVAGLPTDIRGGIAFIAQRFGWPDWLTQLALQMTVLESGGRQFTNSAVPSNAQTGTEQFGPGPDAAILQGRLAAAQKQFYGTIYGQREAMQAEISGLKQLRDQFGATSEAGKQITAVLGPMEGTLKNLRTETEQFTKTQQDQTRVSGIEEGAAKRLADAYLQLDEASIKETGHAATAAQKEAARAEIMKGLSKDMQLVIDAAERQITANNELAKAVMEGNGALEKRQALLKAQQEALAFGPRDSAEYKAAVPLLAQRNLDVAGSEQNSPVAQQIKVTQDNIKMIELETATLNDNYDARTLQLAHEKALLDIKRQYPIASAEYTNALLNETDKLNKSTLELAKQKHALDTITGMFESAFDTISNSITQALVSGQGAAVNWRNVMTSVAQQVLSAFLKLAILNPILNMLNPSGNRDTLTSMFDQLNKTTPGSSSSSSSGGGGTGILGTIFSLVSSIGGLFGGGGAFAAGATGAAGAAESASAIAGTGSGASFGSNFSLNAMHSGGIVGAANDNPMQSIPAAMVANAPRFHSGYGGLRADELPAILQRGERVLTQRDDDRIRSTIGGMTEQLASGMAEGNNHRADTASRGDNVTISIDARNSTPQAVDSFRRSLPQIASTMSDQMQRAKSRNG